MGGMRAVVRGGGRGGRDNQADSHSFAPGVCAAAVALSLFED